MPEAMADEARSFATSQESTMFVTVRTVAPIRLVEFGAGLYVLMGIPVTPFTEHMGPMAEPDFGGPIYLYRLGLSLNARAIMIKAYLSCAPPRGIPQLRTERRTRP
jgi:hypothetical protein